MQASILMSTFNKRDILPNVLEGIKRQEAPFDWECIVIDDASRIKPDRIIKNYPFTYLPLTMHEGGRFAMAKGLELMNPTTEVVVLTSCDVIWLQPNILKELVNGVFNKQPTFAEVINYPVSYRLNDWDAWAKESLTTWDKMPNGPMIYSGSRRPDGYWFFFLSAILKDDLLSLGFNQCGCDYMMDRKMRENGFKPKYLDHLKAIHQAHEWIQHPCREVDKCFYGSFCKARGIRNA